MALVTLASVMGVAKLELCFPLAAFKSCTDVTDLSAWGRSASAWACFPKSFEHHAHSVDLGRPVVDRRCQEQVVSASDHATAVALEIALVVASQQLIPARRPGSPLKH